jgi:quercetin dioxygenase-like cupin family protein
MKSFELKNFEKGWFIGKFEPTVFSADFEVGIKEYKSGDKEQKHYHKLAKEFTVIISGKVKMNDIEYIKGDIIQIDENESTDFECIEDTIVGGLNTNNKFVKSIKDIDNSDKCWGLLKMDFEILSKLSSMLSQSIDEQLEIEIFLNNFDFKTFDGGKYWDLGTWKIINNYWNE